MAPNVVLLVLDTARADALEPYGAPAGDTPAIADLAARGTVQRSAYATACWTLPSHTSMFTGLLPRSSGILDLREGDPLAARGVIEAHRERMLPEVMRRHGYSTAAVSTNLWITPASGFGIGFDSFEAVDTGRQGRIHLDSRRARLRWDAEGVMARVDDGAERALAAVRRLAAERRDGPFFWFVNLVECHSPYLPPRPYNDLGPLDRWRAAEEARRFLTLNAIWAACAGAFEVPDEALARMRHLYRRSIRQLDDWVAAMLEELDRNALLEETLVIVTSDHGENFGENGYMAHAFSLDERLIHVPLVAAGPGAPPQNGAISLADLPPMIAEAAGLDDHPWSNAQSANGVAVAQFEPPAAEDDPKWQIVVDEWRVGYDQVIARLGRPLATATDGRLKLLRRGSAEELYDVVSDPLEVSPAAPADHADGAAVERLRRALEDADRDEAANVVSTETGPPPEITAEEREELEERMRLLGYM